MYKFSFKRRNERTRRCTIAALPLIASCLAGAASGAQNPTETTQDPAQRAAEIERLRSEFEALKRSTQMQIRAMGQIERRLREVEGRPPQAATAPATPSQPGSATPPDSAGLPPQAAGGPEPRPEATAPEPETKREAGPSRSVETVIEEQHALFGRRRAVEVGLTYTSFDRNQLILNGFLALDAIFLGRIDVDKVKSNLITLDLTGRYGFSDRLQANVNVPVIYRNSSFRSAGVGGAGNALGREDVVSSPGIGDANVGLNYRLLAETLSRPDTVLNLTLKAPTGEEPYGIGIVETPGAEGNLNVPEELPTGNGVWSLSTGLSFVKTFDPAILFASIGYTHNFARSFDDISSNPDDQPGKIDLGDSIYFGYGTAFALNERLSLSASISHRLAFQSRQKLDDGSGWQKIIGSDANAITLNIGSTLALTDRLSMVVSAGVGLTPDAPDYSIGIKFPYAF